jgi:RND family efflux transporter MFP subunit
MKEKAGRPPRRLSVPRQLALVLAVAAIGWAAWQGRAAINPGVRPQGQADEGAGRAREVLVGTAAVTAQRSGEAIRAVGTGRAVRSVTLYPQAAGLVEEILFTPGEEVLAFRPLLRLDSDVEAIELRRARSEAANAAQALARLERLAPSGAVPASQVDEARAAALLAEADVDAAAIAFDRRTLRAPFDGVMGLLDVSIGDAINTQTAVATIDDRSEILVEFEVAEAYAARIVPGLGVAASTPAFPGLTFEGEIRAVDSRLDEVSRTLRVRAALPNDEDRLRPGMSFAVELAFPGEPMPAVPAVALQWDRQGAHVWGVIDGAARRIEVRVVERLGGLVLLDAPLAAGDLVVVEGIQRLSEGLAVTIAPAPEATSAPASPDQPG